jgi:photosystem II stability/assembly factor-like uncharacterized protein
MKVKVLFSSIPVIFAIFSLLQPDLFAQSQCSYTWTTQTSGTTSILNSVKAVSPMIAWAGGYNGTVRRTTDGGSTWINANPNSAMINGNVETIEAIDAMNAWCSTSPGPITLIYKTTDGGNIWTQVYAQTSGFINGIRMISSSAGYAFGSPLNSTFLWNILVTSDGGTTWLPLPTRPQGQAGEQGFNNCVQVMMPYMWFGGSFGSVYRSTNGGINWVNVPAPGLAIYVQALHFNSQTGLGLASSTTMDISTNGGTSFTPLAVPGAGNINGIEGAGNELWYVRGENIYKSTNAGVNWALDHNTGITMLAIDFVDNTTGCLEGWAVGYVGTIVKMTGLTVGTPNNQNSLPETYKLSQNYPNPFNPVTKIEFDVPASNSTLSGAKGLHVKLTVTDILGKQVAVLVNENKPAGNYSVNFDASNIPSGVYFYKLESGDFTAVKKMVVMK